MSEWKTYRLGDLCSRIKSGKGIPASEVFTTGEYPVIGGNGIRGYANTSNFNGVCAVVGRQGAYCGNVRFFSGEAYMTEHAVVIVGNELADTRYLAYLLSIMQLGHLSAQSAQPGLSVQTLSKLSINIPDISTQRRIAGILGSLDDKIELNRRINANLEAQAQALFRSWFVNNETIDLQYYELGDVATINAGGDKPTVYSKDLTEQCCIPIYSNGIDNEGLYGYTNSAKINTTSITISARGTIGYICLRTKPYVPIVRLISVVPNKSELSAEFLYLWALTQNISGTGTTQQQLTVPDFRKTSIGLPPEETLKRFNDVIIPIFQKIDTNKNENKTLSALRDTLLPKLMTGEIKI